MKKIVSLPFFLLSLIASGTNYYVKSTGSDSNSGLSDSQAWQTVTKVTARTFLPGDSILFRKGDTWVISSSNPLHVISSGTAGQPIVIGAYGTGNKPVFTSFTTITGWTNEGGGIYSKTVACQPNPDVESYVVTIDGVNTPMGRYPQTGWLIYESVGTADISITDNQLTGTPNWTGAEAVIRKTRWMTDRNLITNHSNQKLTYIPGSNWGALATLGYFFQSDIKTLTYFGAWYYNKTTSKLYMYFGAVDPVTKEVKMATAKTGAYSEYVSYQTFDNLSIVGFNNFGFLKTGSPHITIQNCNFQFIATHAIYIWPYAGDAEQNGYMTIENNTITDCSSGIELRGYGKNHLVKNNIISNIGMIQGWCALKASENWGDGIALFQSNSIIENNKVTNVGHSGIRIHEGDNIVIRNNYVNGFAYTRNDAGGIYTWNSKGYTSNGWKIQNNIVLNGNTGSAGLPSGLDLLVFGIYLDEHSLNAEITGNTAANCPSAGFFIYRTANIRASKNTFFNNGYQIQYSFEWGTVLQIRGCAIDSNIFFCKSADQLALHFKSTTNDIPLFGTSNNNYYVRPIKDDNTFYTYDPTTGSKYRTLSGWQIFTGQDANSYVSQFAVTDTADIDFYYNPSNSNKVFTLNQPMIDVKGNQYQNSITLLPFTSAVLMVDPNPAQPVTPLYSGSVVENSSPSSLIITYSVNLSENAPLPGAFVVKVNGISRSVTSVFIEGNKVTLTLSSPIVFGNNVTFSYTKSGTVWLHTPSGGDAANLTDQTVENNCLDPSTPNDPPVLVINNEASCFSGFVGEIDASGSYDINNDTLVYSWIVPNDVSVSSALTPKIRFLAPMISSAQDIEFILNVNDGRVTVPKSIPITIMPYKPDLAVGRVSSIKASDYQSPDLPNNIVDGNLSTKWSINGDNQWLLLELSDPFKLSHLEIGFLSGQKFASYFDILASKDNISWESVLPGTSSCDFSGGMQVFNFPLAKTNTEFSYIKLIGHGNSENTWNYVSELRLFGMLQQNSGTPNPEGSSIVIYPNPARDYFNISIEDPKLQPNIIRIIDLSGRIILTDTMAPGIMTVQIPGRLNSGIYIVEMCNGDIILAAKKVIIERAPS